MSTQHKPGRKLPAVYIKKCGRCNGVGAIACFSPQYSGKCFACNGAGKLFISKAEFDRLIAARAKRIAAKAAGSASRVGLGKVDGAILTPASDVDQRVPVTTPGAQEKDAVAVNFWLDRSEHDFESAASALPHRDSPIGDSQSGAAIAMATGAAS